MKYEIELPDMMHRDVRYEPTGEFRAPKVGDWFLNVNGNVEYADFNLESNVRIILRPVWTWPEWLGGYCFAMNENGGMLWHSTQCQRVPNIWLSAGHQATMSTLVAIHPGFTPPTITDWTKPIINPRWKQPNV